MMFRRMPSRSMNQPSDPVPENPYQPSARDAEPPVAAPQRHGFSWLAALGGFAVDIVATLFGGCIIGVVVALALLAMGAGPGELEAGLSQMLIVYVVGSIYGLLCTVLGGYVAAWIAGFAPIRHALGAGLLSLLSGIATSFLPISSDPLWLSLAGLVLILPAAALGGKLCGSEASRRR